MNSGATMADRIETKLNAAFAPSELLVEDQSDQHIGHAGYRDGGGTHFAVRIRAEAFAAQSRVAQQRLIYAELKEEFADGLHALSLDVGAGR